MDATLAVVQTAPECLSYRLLVDGRVAWSNRVYATPEGRAGARSRLRAWAQRRGIRVVDSRGITLVEPPEVERIGRVA
jgi:hypothetical protein